MRRSAISPSRCPSICGSSYRRFGAKPDKKICRRSGGEPEFEVRFALDSPVEGDGFEPSIPRLLCSGGIKEFVTCYRTNAPIPKRTMMAPVTSAKSATRVRSRCVGRARELGFYRIELVLKLVKNLTQQSVFHTLLQHAHVMPEEGCSFI